MKDLIERLEKASEGSRELDRSIMAALYSEPLLPRKHDIPHYTTSLDAACSALPLGYQLRLEPRFDADGEKVNWRAYAIKPHWERYNPIVDDWFTVTEARHRNEYLAAIIAALRARGE